MSVLDIMRSLGFTTVESDKPAVRYRVDPVYGVKVSFETDAGGYPVLHVDIDSGAIPALARAHDMTVESFTDELNRIANGHDGFIGALKGDKA